MPITAKSFEAARVAASNMEGDAVVASVPNPEGFRTLLANCLEKKELATWSEAWKAAGFTGNFQNSCCAALTTFARECGKGWDALICSATGTYGLRVMDGHLATLEGFGYDATLIDGIRQASLEAASKAGEAKERAKARKAAEGIETTIRMAALQAALKAYIKA